MYIHIVTTDLCCYMAETNTMLYIKLKIFKKESACQCRGNGFNPWSGKIPRAKGQLSPCATTTEARVPYSPSSTTTEATAMRRLHTTMKRSPCPSQLEKALTQQQKTQSCQK